ncbi:hypothetical protein GALMADRAFT_885383 [Galerina marginata CBS 339.88]|uniref:Uncharacterized protein n=1 Tax=Galerina marginata (strain CBS 339.88) TaxID=685588 RepID=A0A067SS19_GALM3|nr:hypothetical protein GALMADRAFT_885383 [Galerina marginata CBS 339.88]
MSRNVKSSWRSVVIRLRFIILFCSIVILPPQLDKDGQSKKYSPSPELVFSEIHRMQRIWKALSISNLSSGLMPSRHIGVVSSIKPEADYDLPAERRGLRALPSSVQSCRSSLFPIEPSLNA